jgi:predicted DNA-binding transcriptional regulator AlpA
MTITESHRRSSDTPAVLLAPLWTVHDVSAFLRVSVQTLYAWRSRRIGPPARRLGKHLRYVPSDVEAWVKEQGQEGD